MTGCGEEAEEEKDGELHSCLSSKGGIHGAFRGSVNATCKGDARVAPPVTAVYAGARQPMHPPRILGRTNPHLAARREYGDPESL